MAGLIAKSALQAEDPSSASAAVTTIVRKTLKKVGKKIGERIFLTASTKEGYSIRRWNNRAGDRNEK